MTKTHTKTHKRCTAPFPHHGGSWVHTDGKLVREKAPDAATTQAPAAGSEQTRSNETSADATSSESKRGRRDGK